MRRVIGCWRMDWLTDCKSARARNGGTITGRIAVAENSDGAPQFYVVPTFQPFPATNDVLLVYNQSGVLMPNSDGLNFDPNQQFQVVSALGSTGNRHMLFTVGTDGKLYYHVVDMDRNNGTGDVIARNQLLLPDGGYQSVLLAAEDYGLQNTMLLVSKSTTAGQLTLQKITVGALNANDSTLAQTPVAETMLNLNSCYGLSSVQLSPDGQKMLLYSLTSQPTMFTSNAEIRVYNLANNLTLGQGEPKVKALPQTGVGCKATFSADGSSVVVETKEDTHNKLYSYNLISESLEPLLTEHAGDPQLFSDGRVYVSQSGTQTLQTYGADLTPGYSVALSGTLTGSLAQRVYRTQSTETNPATLYARAVGLKKYELKDHLGNVRAVVSDVKTQQPDNVYKTGLLAAYNYYPFGMLMPGLYTGNSVGEGGYRYGFNGKEKDDDVTGTTGVTYDYGFRIYDARVARFLSVDPLTKSYPMLTPYQFASNTPIQAIDLDGLEAVSKQFEYRVMGGTEVMSITHSGAIGLTIEVTTGNFGLYVVPTLGVGAGAGGLAGSSWVVFPNASIEDISGFGWAAGVIWTPFGSGYFGEYDRTGTGKSGGSGGPLVGEFIGVYGEVSYTHYFSGLKGNVFDLSENTIKKVAEALGYEEDVEDFLQTQYRTAKKIYEQYVEEENKKHLTIDEMVEKGWTLPSEAIKYNEEMKTMGKELKAFFEQNPVQIKMQKNPNNSK
ncbi:MAG: RHS repeat-associated core domain-containing protein [Bacteroidales bacterium]|nr:RHS repeat-associated core domain-containing protein [Bacteroidales bacterium]